MPLTSVNAYINSVKQRIPWFKTGARTTVAGIPFSMFELAGVPGAGTLNIGNTANGVVPDDSVAGYPVIDAIAGVGYLTRVEIGWSVAGRLAVYDRLFAAGAYAFNADVSLTSQPSFAARVPGANYKGGIELWIETVTVFTGSPSFQINYLDDDGVAGDTGVIASGAAMTLGRMFRMPLASGDNGVSRLDRVRGTVASAGTFNVCIMRRLWEGRVKIANDGDIHDLFRTGAPRVYPNSALFVVLTADAAASGLPELSMEIADA